MYIILSSPEDTFINPREGKGDRDGDERDRKRETLIQEQHP